MIDFEDALVEGVNFQSIQPISPTFLSALEAFRFIQSIPLLFSPLSCAGILSVQSGFDFLMSFAFRALIAVSLLAVTLVTAVTLRAQDAFSYPERQVSSKPVEAVAVHQESWARGEMTVTAIRGSTDGKGLAGLRQGREVGDLQLLGESIVIVDRLTADGHEIAVYAEDRVSVTRGDQTQNLATHVVRLNSIDAVHIKTTTDASQVATPSGLMKRALKRIYPQSTTELTPVSQQAKQDLFIPPRFETPDTTTALTRRVQVRPRSSQPLQFDTYLSRDTVPEERVYVFTGGVRVLVDGAHLDLAGMPMQPGVLDLSADRVVVWTDPNAGRDLNDAGGIIEQSSARRLQIYLEGDILVRQQQNTVTASHAFYDANNDRALLMNAELRAFLPQTGGEFRVRAERLRQVSQNRFHAQNAWTTTSPYGKPGYRVQASDIYVEPGPISPFTEIDPLTGQAVNGPPLWITALNTKFIVGDIPLLWLPRLTAPAEDPNIPIRRAAVRHDRIFGLQFKTVWNLTKILGQPKQQGMQWDLLADYMSDRGPSLGVQGYYDMRNNLGRANGNASIIYQYDDGVDNLGLTRQQLVPEEDHRGQVIWQHKQELPGRVILFGEIGYISDRNYRESFQELPYDTEKDAETLLGVRQDFDLWSGTLWGRTELNEFETTTDWLPRADLFGFSQPLLNGSLHWSSHSSVGYADLEAGSPPRNPADPYTSLALPYYADSTGLVAMTRHQLEAPFMLGAVNLNPFVMGEAAFWDEGLGTQDVDRYLVSTGVQAHLSATRIFPFVRDDLWNLNGLAHKTDTYLEYRFTDASRNLNEITQYNEIDDNAQERFRTRYTTQIYPGLIPAEFDPRFYAVRNGAGLWVSAPYHELVEDQQTLRLRFRNRLQTKVGPFGSQRIRDWMIWELGATYFPDAVQDNFGEDFGLFYGNYRWNISDRTSILADGIVDLFRNSQDVWSLGVLSQRSLRGSMYLGYRKVEATNYVDSQTLVASYSYQLSPKWISTGSVAYDVAAGESRGSSLTFSRVGLDWVLHFGLGIDTSKDNVGVAFAVEPRFGPPSPTNLSYLLGLQR